MEENNGPDNGGDTDKLVGRNAVVGHFSVEMSDDEMSDDEDNEYDDSEISSREDCRCIESGAYLGIANEHDDELSIDNPKSTNRYSTPPPPSYSTITDEFSAVSNIAEVSSPHSQGYIAPSI